MFAGIVSGCVKNAMQRLPNIWKPRLILRRLLFNYQRREKKLCKLKNLAATWFVPLVIDFDLESFFCPAAGCTPHKKNSYTRVNEKHKPCGFSLALIDHNSTKPIFLHVDSSEGCITNTVQMLHALAKDKYKRKRAFLFFRGDRSHYPKKQLANVGYVTSLLRIMLTVVNWSGSLSLRR